MVLAAGFGMRFRPATNSLPKPMIPLCLRPLVEWALDSLVRAGVGEVVINLHHLPVPLERFVVEHYGEKLSIAFSLEEKILGTGGGLARVRSFFESEKSFYLVNGDTIQCARLRDLEIARSEHDAIASLLLRPRLPGALYTGVTFDGTRINGFGDDPGDLWMFAGAHALTPEIFQWIPPSGEAGIVSHAYEPILDASDAKIVGVAWDGVWHDIGTPARYLDATRDLIAQMERGVVPVPSNGSLEEGSLAGQSAILRGSLYQSVVGQRSVVGVGSRVLDSVIWDDCRIGIDSEIERSILTHGVSLPDGMQIRNALICTSVRGGELPPGGRMLGNDLVATPIDSEYEMTISGERI